MTNLITTPIKAVVNTKYSLFIPCNIVFWIVVIDIKINTTDPYISKLYPFVDPNIMIYISLLNIARPNADGIVIK